MTITANTMNRNELLRNLRAALTAVVDFRKRTGFLGDKRACKFVEFEAFKNHSVDEFWSNYQCYFEVPQKSERFMGEYFVLFRTLLDCYQACCDDEDAAAEVESVFAKERKILSMIRRGSLYLELNQRKLRQANDVIPEELFVKIRDITRKRSKAQGIDMEDPSLHPGSPGYEVVVLKQRINLAIECYAERLTPEEFGEVCRRLFINMTDEAIQTDVLFFEYIYSLRLPFREFRDRMWRIRTSDLSRFALGGLR